jgi:hypothetical protein
MKNTRKKLQDLKNSLLSVKKEQVIKGATSYSEIKKALVENDVVIGYIKTNPQADGMISFSEVEKVNINNITSDGIYVMLKDKDHNPAEQKGCFIMIRGKDMTINEDYKDHMQLFELVEAKECKSKQEEDKEDRYNESFKNYYETDLKKKNVAYIRNDKENRHYMDPRWTYGYSAKEVDEILLNRPLGAIINEQGLIDYPNSKKR